MPTIGDPVSAARVSRKCQVKVTPLSHSRECQLKVALSQGHEDRKGSSKGDTKNGAIAGEVPGKGAPDGNRCQV